MILKNNNGKEREFKILLRIEKSNNRYIIYKDLVTNNIYAGKYKSKKLNALSDEEYEVINSIFERIEG